MSIITPFQLLEINVISAQDLDPVCRSMRTYAVAWVHPTRKLTTRVDSHGHTSPTWNDKFVFRVDEEFLRSDTSAVMVEVYALHWFKDIHVGTVRVLVGNLISPSTRPGRHNHHIGMRFVALQVRRQSGRPQGILNIGVALLDSSMRSMPLYAQLSTSAVGYRTFLGEEQHSNNHHSNNDNSDSYTNNQADIIKSILRRSKSERSERDRNPPSLDEFSQKGSSIINGSELGASQVGNKGKRSKASSIVNGLDFGAPTKVKKGTRSKAGSLINVSDIENPPRKKGSIINGLEPVDPLKKETDVKPVSKTTGLEFGPLKKGALINGNSFKKSHGYEFMGPTKGKFRKGGSMLSASDVGPSPSEVAAAVAQEAASSVVDDGWSMDESMEGLQSKLERWRTELPPVFDRGEYGSFKSSGHTRRHTDGGAGLFTCFGNVFGYECSCICGKPNPAKGPNPSSSMDTVNRDGF